MSLNYYENYNTVVKSLKKKRDLFKNEMNLMFFYLIELYATLGLNTSINIISFNFCDRREYCNLSLKKSEYYEKFDTDKKKQSSLEILKMYEDTLFKARKFINKIFIPVLKQDNKMVSKDLLYLFLTYSIKFYRECCNFFEIGLDDFEDINSYDEIINKYKNESKILSKIIYPDKELEFGIDPNYMNPAKMESFNENGEVLERNYVKIQRHELKEKYKLVIMNYIDKFEIRMNLLHIDTFRIINETRDSIDRLIRAINLPGKTDLQLMMDNIIEKIILIENEKQMKITLEKLMRDYWVSLAEIFIKYINALTEKKEFAIAESNLDEFCKNENIPNIEILYVEYLNKKRNDGII